jgi:hypothetical protein
MPPIYYGTVKICSKKRSYGKNKLSLNVWNNDIKSALKCNKEAHQQLKKHGRPNDPTNSLVIPYDRFLEQIFTVPVNIVIVSRRASSIVILSEWSFVVTSGIC